MTAEQIRQLETDRAAALATIAIAVGQFANLAEQIADDRAEMLTSIAVAVEQIAAELAKSFARIATNFADLTDLMDQIKAPNNEQH